MLNRIIFLIYPGFLNSYLRLICQRGHPAAAESADKCRRSGIFVIKKA